MAGKLPVPDPFLLYHAYFKLAIFHVYKTREPVASIISWQQKKPPIAGGMAFSHEAAASASCISGSRNCRAESLNCTLILQPRPHRYALNEAGQDHPLRFPRRGVEQFRPFQRFLDFHALGVQCFFLGLIGQQDALIFSLRLLQRGFLGQYTNATETSIAEKSVPASQRTIRKESMKRF